MTSADHLRRQTETLLGWKEGDSDSFSLATLREWVREKDPKLHRQMGELIDSGEHLLEKPAPKKAR